MRTEKLQMKMIFHAGLITVDEFIGFRATLPRSREITIVVSATQATGIPKF